MKRTIELKHVGAAKPYVRRLLEELLDRLEEKLRHVPSDAVSAHALFEENGTHKLYRASLTCHIPGRTMVAHEERRDAGAAIRDTFAEMARQMEKQKAALRHERMRRRSQRRSRTILLMLLLSLRAASPVNSEIETSSSSSTSPKAADAAGLLGSRDPYLRQLGFLRLEALREPGSLHAIDPYLTSRDPDARALAARALAAIQGAAAAPRLLDILKTDKSAVVRRAALLGLEPLEPADPAILPACIKALRDRNPEVRMAAVDIVSRLHDPRAREAILLRNRRERDRNVRRVLPAALQRLHGSSE